MNFLEWFWANAANVLATLGIIGIIGGFLASRLKPVRAWYSRHRNAAMIALLRHNITMLYYTVKTRSEIREYEKQNLIQLFKEYERLGGNGYIKEIYEDLMHYPIA